MLFHKYQLALLVSLMSGFGCATTTSNQPATGKAESSRSAEVDQEPAQEKVGRTLYHNSFSSATSSVTPDVWGDENASPSVFMLICLLDRNQRTGLGGVKVVPSEKGGFNIQIHDDCLDPSPSDYGDSANQEYYKWTCARLADLGGNNDNEAQPGEYLEFLERSFVALAGLDDQVPDALLHPRTLVEAKPFMQKYINILKSRLFGLDHTTIRWTPPRSNNP